MTWPRKKRFGPDDGPDPMLVPADSDQPGHPRRGERRGPPAPPPTPDPEPEAAWGEPVVPADVPPPQAQDRRDTRYARTAAQAVAELVRRRSESLKLYEPMPIQERFHASQALTRLLLGGNRGGKTTPAATEVARAVTGQDPHDKWAKTDGTFLVVGKDLNHIGKVMYPRLFMKKKEGFRIIKDVATGLWRAFHPWDEADMARSRDSRVAGPLIPERLVKERSWYSKKDNQPRMVRLWNGWELFFYSSESDPPGGFPADGAWFDEEIVRSREWLDEAQARLVDRQGRLVWSATPQAATEELYDLHQQAIEEAGDPKPTVMEFFTHLDLNVHIPDASKEIFKARMRRRGDEAYQVRVEGAFAIEGDKIYPEYGDHLRVKRFLVPEDWCHYVIVDPGRVCGGLDVVVPPPEDPVHGRHVYFTEELYVKQCDAKKFARGLKAKLHTSERHVMPHAFFIDNREGRKHETGSGVSIRRRYSRELAKRKVRSVLTHYSFLAAPDRPESNREALHNWMTPDDDGFVKLRVFNDLENFDREMRNYRYRRVAGVVTGDAIKKNDHLCDCAGYAAGLDLVYHRPKGRANLAERGILRKLAEKRRRMSRGRKGKFINMGMGQ